MARRNALFRRIHNELHDDIAAGRIVPGDMLPSENELCRRFVTSRFTVRSALKLLDAEGMVHNLPGRGWRVQSNVPVERQEVTSGAHGVISDRAVVYLGRNEQCSSLLFDGIREVLQRHRIRASYQPLVKTDFASDGLEELCRIITPDQTQGAVIFSDAELPDRFYRFFADQGVPLVVVGLRKHCPCDTVSGDYYHGSRAMCQHLIDLGHRHIGFFGGRYLSEHNPSFRSRLKGYSQCMQAAGLEAATLLIDYEFFVDDPVGKLEDWLAKLDQLGRLPTALFLNGNQCERLPYLLERIGFRIPDDISLCGFGQSFTNVAGYQGPNDMGRVIEPWHDIAHAAGHRLLARIQGDESAPSLTMVPPPLHHGETIVAPPNDSARVLGSGRS